VQISVRTIRSLEGTHKVAGVTVVIMKVEQSDSREVRGGWRLVLVPRICRRQLFALHPERLKMLEKAPGVVAKARARNEIFILEAKSRQNRGRIEAE
jgi:hypothetical protein